MKKAIVSDKAPAAVGPYVHAYVAGDTLYSSGQLGLIPESGEFEEGVKAQAERALSNLDLVLKEAGFSKEDVVRTMVFLDSMDDFATVNEVYAAYFGDHKPARSCVEVSKLPKGGLVEIECIACK